MCTQFTYGTKKIKNCIEGGTDLNKIRLPQGVYDRIVKNWGKRREEKERGREKEREGRREERERRKGSASII
jgi:hypothetical protein